MTRSRRRSVVRTTVSALAVVAMLVFVLTSCPSNRDGVVGQLAQARDEVGSATRSAALALDMWAQGRSTNQLVSVQLTDMRDHIVDSYDDVAELQVDEPAEVSRQQLLTEAITSIIALLNSADAAVRGVLPADAREAGRRLGDEADALADGSRW